MAEWRGKNTVEEISDRVKSLSVSEGCLKKGGSSKRRSNIPRLKQQRLSASDSLCETTRPSSSSSSCSSLKSKYTKENFRRSSETSTGYFLSQGLRARHAAHRCAWSESDKCSPSSSGQFKQTTISNCISSSSSGSRMYTTGAHSKEGDRKKTSGNTTGSSSRQKFDFYMPLCEVQQQLKRGELIEGILRVNPRNYEDSYISAPDGQMDIYVGGLHDRNRALNGDKVAVQLYPPHLWKIITDDAAHLERVLGTNQPTEEKQFQQPCISVLPSNNTNSVDWGHWSGNGPPLECDTVEILDVPNILRQAGLNSNGQNYSFSVSDVQSLTVTPDELLDLSGLHIPDDEKGACNDDDCCDHAISKAVAPDMLSEDEFSPCHSDDSVASTDLSRALEDSLFLASQQNALNNNIPAVVEILSDPPEPIGLWQAEAASQPLEQPSDLSASKDLSVENSPKKPKKRRRKKKKNKKFGPKTDENSVPPSVIDGTEDGHCSHLQKLSVEEIMKFPNWEKIVQKTGKVVHILERKHSRIAVGYIKLMQDKNRNLALFAPIDHKLPRFCISMLECPKGFYERLSDFAKTLFAARITDWDETATFAKGTLIKTLGESGEVEPETEGILLENGVDYREFDKHIIGELAHLSSNWEIPQSEIKSRLDLRKSCVFTIDPKTARDLDDALSFRKADDGLFEIGVHIADVSYFLKDGTLLDKVARERATSVYLVQKVVPMLPRILCEKLCSLHPGEDRLTVSVIWKMNPDGSVLSETICRSIIHSCVKLSYEHAQDMIENPDKEWLQNEMPDFFNGFGAKEVSSSIQQLHKIAVQLRARRFKSGALRLDQTKISFTLDSETGLPSGYSLYEYRDSNKLVEEFMLLANMTVAHKIYGFCKEKAFLRCHPPPYSKTLNDVVEMCATLGIHLDISTSGTLQHSLAAYGGDDLYSIARITILTLLIAKPMKPAAYFCSEFALCPADFHHYALNVPLYTHFTSPIRRYPDVIVHRMLAAAIGVEKMFNMTAEELQTLANHCNDKKYAAKRVYEVSCDFFLSIFVQMTGPLEEKAVVVATLDHSFDVLIMRMGAVKRIYIDKLNLVKVIFKKEEGIPQLILTWPSQHVQLISIFTIVDVILVAADDKPIRFNAILKAPSSS